jgi:transketolase
MSEWPAVRTTEALARRIRVDAVVMCSLGGGSHVGSCLSIADIMAVLFGQVLSLDATRPLDPRRDRFLLSKGHAGAAVYASLAETGFFPRELLATHYADGSVLSGHVSHRNVPGVEWSTGSLGQALSVAVGMAVAARLKRESHRIVVLLSDGECDEGQVWEAAMFAAHHRLDSVVAIIDYNGIQSLDTTHNTLDLEPFVGKWEAFGWEVREVPGHDHAAIVAGLAPSTTGRPLCVVARTTKGKGVPMMEGQVLWHYRTPRDAELETALSALSATEDDRRLLDAFDVGMRIAADLKAGAASHA